jgi:hypothetical protein
VATTLGESDYRRGAQERLHGSLLLLEENALAGSLYLGGRAVEATLRGLIWRYDSKIRTGRQSLETGHDLRQLLGVIQGLGAIRSFKFNAKLIFSSNITARL